MTTEKIYPDYHQQPLCLTQEESANPLSVLKRFCDARSLPEHRQILWEIFSTAFSNPETEALPGNEVGQWVLYHRLLEELIEAVWIMPKEDDNQS